MINLHICFIFFGAAVYLNKCNQESSKPDLDPPVFTLQDSIYHGVFFPWDGIWKGQFIIYQDPQGQQNPTNETISIDSNLIKKMNLEQIVDVRQMYKSITPYYQEVEITDTYLEPNDTVHLQSKGINKVENGKLWCIVEKPQERVAHEGIFKKDGKLIWYRQEENPLRIEYFIEEISKNTYTILGYGYYGDDNPNLAPKTWFYAKYHRMSDYFR